MDEKHVLQKFRRQKIITINQLVKLLTCSVITARRRLKKTVYGGIKRFFFQSMGILPKP